MKRSEILLKSILSLADRDPWDEHEVSDILKSLENAGMLPPMSGQTNRDEPIVNIYYNCVWDKE